MDNERLRAEGVTVNNMPHFPGRHCAMSVSEPRPKVGGVMFTHVPPRCDVARSRAGIGRSSTREGRDEG